MNRGLSILFVAASLIVLAGCSTVPPMESLGEIPVSAVMDPDTPTDVFTLGPRQYVTYIIDVPPNSAEAVWFEAAINDSASGLRLLLDSGGGQTYTSSSDRGFQLVGSDLLLPSDPGFQTSTVDFNLSCRGPCIAVGSTLATETLQIQNRSSVSRQYELYVYDEMLQDTNEPNDSQGSATSLPFGQEVDSGAIELIGDRDYFHVPVGGQFELSVPSGAPLIAEVISGGNVVDTAGPNESVLVLSDEYVRIRAEDDAYAGPPNGNASLYFVSLE